MRKRILLFAGMIMMLFAMFYLHTNLVSAVEGEETAYTVILKATDGGAIALIPQDDASAGTYTTQENVSLDQSERTSCEVYAKAEEGCHFLGWRYGDAHGEDLTALGFRIEDQTDWNNEPVSKLEVPAKENCTIYAVFGHTVSFDSCGGSEVETQYVIQNEEAAEPVSPTKGGLRFQGWYTDKTLENEEYYFGSEVTEDMTLYAGWCADIYLGIYNQDNPDADYSCGTIDIEELPSPQDSSETPVSQPIYDVGMNELHDPLSVIEGKIARLTAKNTENFEFMGWYEGEPGKDANGEFVVKKRSGDPLTEDKAYTITADQSQYLCAVFKCAEHQWGAEIIEDATILKEGRKYKICSVCGAMNDPETIPKKTGSGSSVIQNIPTVIIDTTSEGSTGGTGASGGTAITGTAGSTINQTRTVSRAANPLKIKAKKVTVKYSRLKKKTQKIKIKKAVKFINKGIGSKTYLKIKGDSKIQINRKTGKITIKKGLKKGTYKVKFLITADGNHSYKPGYKTVTCKIKVR